MCFRWWVSLFVAAMTLTACSPWLQMVLPPTKQADLPEADALLIDVSHRNHALKSFKGIGRAVIIRNGRTYSSRVAWAAAAPERLRVELIAAPGQPKVGFSTDGRWLYYYDPNDSAEPIKRIPSSDPDLRRFTSIAITAKDIISILSGRIPPYDHHSLKLRQTDDPGGYVLIRSKKWWMGNQRIYLTADQNHIEKVELWKSGQLIYQVTFKGRQTVQSYHIPKSLIISRGDGNRFQLDIDRYWADIPVTPELFILKPPGP